VSFVALLLTNDPLIDIFAIVFLAVGASSIVGFDIFHPFTWYSSFFTLYSIGHSVLYLAGRSFVDSYSEHLMPLQWLGLTVSLLIVSPIRVLLNREFYLEILGGGEHVWADNTAQKLGISEGVKFDDIVQGGEPISKSLDRIDVYRSYESPVSCNFVKRL